MIEDVPLPIALPFAFFPITKKGTSGIIMPTYGEERMRGFNGVLRMAPAERPVFGLIVVGQPLFTGMVAAHGEIEVSAEFVTLADHPGRRRLCPGQADQKTFRLGILRKRGLVHNM